MSEIETDLNLSNKIPVGWTLEIISKAFIICNNLRFPISEEVRKTILGEYPYYGPTKIQDYINEFRVNGKYALIGEDGDHFLKWRELPMTQLIEGKFNVNNHVHLIKGEKNLTEWFYFYFNHKELTPYLTRQGAGRYKLTKDSLSKIPCLIPPINEQRKIVDVLSCIEKTINITTKLISKKEKNRKWLMQQLLTGKKRLKGFENDSWSYLSFSDIYSKIKIKAGTERLIILSVTKNGIVLQNEYFNKEIASEDTSNYLVMKKGDMVLSGLNFWMGSIDTLTEFEKGMVSPAYKVYEIINDGISESYMKFFVRSRIMLQALVGSSVVGASVVRRNMDTETLHEWPFYLPHIKEQNAIANILTSVDKEIKLLKEKVEKLKEQKKGLMQVLLTGKKRLK